MIVYLIKSAACMLLLLLVYHAFLEREKMHRFNRFFLIFSLVFSLTVPLLTVNIGSPPPLSDHIDAINHRLITQRPATTEFTPKVTPKENPTVTKPDSSGIYYPLLIGIYVFISSVLLIRLLHNLYMLYATIQKNAHVCWKNVTLVLVDDGSIPHSFFNYIFVDRKRYQPEKINDVVLTHELTHTRQKHSLDILFIEGLKIAFWFNPVLYFYKKAMQTNHEFLADDSVVAGSNDVKRYQKLLLKMQSNSKPVQLASSIQFSITKKRIIMMTKKSTRLRTLCKQLALIPVLTGLIFAFSTRTTSAQNVNQMSLSELMDAVYERMEATDSLTTEDKEALNNFIKKMRSKIKPRPTEPAPAPKPPHKMKLKPPPNAPKKDSIAIRKISKEYKKRLNTYMSVKPIGENKAELKAAFDNVEMVIDTYIDTYNKISKKIADLKLPAPPIMQTPRPAERIEKLNQVPKPPVQIDSTKLNQVSKEYYLLIEEYLKIKPAEEHRAKMESMHKDLVSLYDKWIKEFKDNGSTKKLAPYPPSPTDRIETQSN